MNPIDLKWNKYIKMEYNYNALQEIADFPIQMFSIEILGDNLTKVLFKIDISVYHSWQ